MDSVHVALLAELQAVSYVKAAFLALLAYDTLLEINQEYLHVWKARWTLIKCLYLWARYSTFIGSIASLLHSLVCSRLTTFITIFSGFGISITELILMVRTYTLYERSKRLLVFFFLMWFSVSGATFWAVTKWSSGPSSTITESDAPSIASCSLGTSSSIGIGLVCYLSLLVGETIIVLLTLWKLFRKFPHNTSGLLQSLYRDGVWFYLAILPFTIGSVAILFFAPLGLTGLANPPMSVMHSVLCCRLITHVRETAAEEDKRALAGKRVSEAVCRLYPDHVIDISPANKV